MYSGIAIELKGMLSLVKFRRALSNRGDGDGE
jgi:hypothetical protein